MKKIPTRQETPLPPGPRKAQRTGSPAFTLAELMVAISMTAVLLICVLWGVVSLQHSYAATEEYAAGQADQARLLDFLALDLRRGIQLSGNTACYTVDPDGQGIQINVPDLYVFNANDPQHLYPCIVRPTYDPTTQSVYYNGSGSKVASGAPVPHQVIAYRYHAADGSITRSDPWQPRVADGAGGFAAVPMVVATNMEAFPTIVPDPADLSGNTVHYAVSFRSTFQLLSTKSNGAEITLHNVTFIRSKNLVH